MDTGYSDFTLNNGGNYPFLRITEDDLIRYTCTMENKEQLKKIGQNKIVVLHYFNTVKTQWETNIKVVESTKHIGVVSTTFM